MAPAGTQPPWFQFWAGQNLNITPRWDLPLGFEQLETLSMYPLVRVIIENVKDQITRMPWKIQLRSQPGEPKAARVKREKGDKIIMQLSRLFEYPDSENDWGSWARPLLEDMLVIDAPCVLKRFDKKGALYELRVMKGKMFTRLIDENGYTPQPPNPAYTQLWWGAPAIQLTTKQLLYKPRNIVTRASVSSSLYGASPVEQSAPWIEVGMARLAWQMMFYAKGSVPDMLQVVPRGVQPNVIEEASMVMNSQLAGNLAKRRQIVYAQGFTEDGKDQILFPKIGALSDPFDELIIRWLCFAFGTSPQRLMRMMGTRNAGEQQEAAEMEGLLPWVNWLTGFINWIIQKDLGLTEYEIIFATSQEADQVKRAQADKSDVDSGIISRNEARENRGLDPDPSPEAGQLCVTLPTGVVPIAGSIDATEAAREIAANPPEPKQANNSPAPNDDKPAKKLAKHGKVVIDPSKLEHHSSLAKGKIETAVAKVFMRQREQARRKADELLKGFEADLLKTITPEEFTMTRFYNSLAVGSITKTQSAKQIADEIYKSIEAEWETLPPAVRNALESAGRAGVTKGMADLTVTDIGSINAANDTAIAYAEKRAAELVGMKYDANGDLVANPNAKWAISDTTRDDLRRIVKNAFEQETRMPDLVDEIKNAGSFSDSRADMIARTEVSTAQSKGNFSIWKESGLVETKSWLLSADHTEEDECDDNADAGPIPIDELFPSGDECPPSHPNDFCILLAGTIDSGDVE